MSGFVERGLIGAKAVCSQPNLKIMWPRTTRFVRLTLSSTVLMTPKRSNCRVVRLL